MCLVFKCVRHKPLSVFCFIVIIRNNTIIFHEGVTPSCLMPLKEPFSFLRVIREEFVNPAWFLSLPYSQVRHKNWLIFYILIGKKRGQHLDRSRSGG
ncbi:ORF142 [White spot syndrome virus]|uniref:ORF142 n=1 Tax=White spot syndrome virus TaxID=342409 RepID=A0A2D3I5M4_9VIRU|nr:ORF142 [White spot syndrome virus]